MLPGVKGVDTPVPPRAISSVPEVIFATSRPGMSAGPRVRNAGGAAPPLEGPARSVFAAAVAVPMPPKETPSVPEVILDASREGTSAAASGRNAGAALPPEAGPAKTALAAAPAVPMPPLATPRGVPNEGAVVKVFAPPMLWLPVRSTYPEESPPTSEIASDAGAQREPSKRSTCDAAGTVESTETPCSFATSGLWSAPARSPPHWVEASYLALKRVQSTDDRYPSAEEDPAAIDISGTDEPFHTVSGATPTRPVTVPPESSSPAGSHADPFHLSTWPLAGGLAETGRDCRRATTGAASVPARSPPHCVAAPYFELNVLQSVDERYPGELAAAWGIDRYGTVVGSLTVRGPAAVTPVTVPDVAAAHCHVDASRTSTCPAAHACSDSVWLASSTARPAPARYRALPARRPSASTTVWPATFSSDTSALPPRKFRAARASGADPICWRGARTSWPTLTSSHRAPPSKSESGIAFTRPRKVE